MKKNLVPLLLALILGGFLVFYNFAIQEKEELLESSDSIILALEPYDPRSLMQGDYMELNFVGAAMLLRHQDAREGFVIVALSPEDGVWVFVRQDDGSSLNSDEKRLKYRIIKRGRGFQRVQIAGGSWFFQEGYEAVFGQARFAKLHVAEDGTALIVALLDQDKKKISASSPKEK